MCQWMVWSLLLMSMLGLVEESSAQEQTARYIAYAEEIAVWLASVKQESSEGIRWPVDALRPGDYRADMGEGTGGVIRFYLALYKATDNPAYLEEAERGAHVLQSWLQTPMDSLQGEPRLSSLYGGIPSVGIVLHELYRHTNNLAYLEDVEAAIQWLDDAAQEEGFLFWNGFNDVLSGLAGTGLFLVDMFEGLGSQKALALAQRAAKTLEHRSQITSAGHYWRIGPTMNFNLPNFSHGTAGIGFFFARLYEVTGEAGYLETAKQAARYLESIAALEGQKMRIPYGVPNEGFSRPYDIGWAHGGAGTLRLFAKLDQLTDESRWSTRVRQLANSLMESGAPGQPQPAYGDEPFSLDQRFGLAGAASTLLQLYAKHGDVRYLQATQAYADAIWDAREQEHAYWEISRERYMGHAGEPARFTGYFYGAAGYGLLMLQLHTTLQEQSLTLLWPDQTY